LKAVLLGNPVEPVKYALSDIASQDRFASFGGKGDVVVGIGLVLEELFHDIPRHYDLNAIAWHSIPTSCGVPGRSVPKREELPLTG
jgi:hypothetical protein